MAGGPLLAGGSVARPRFAVGLRLAAALRFRRSAEVRWCPAVRCWPGLAAGWVSLLGRRFAVLGRQIRCRFALAGAVSRLFRIRGGWPPCLCRDAASGRLPGLRGRVRLTTGTLKPCGPALTTGVQDRAGGGVGPRGRVAGGAGRAAMRRQAAACRVAEAGWRSAPMTSILKLGGPLLTADLHDCGCGARRARGGLRVVGGGGPAAMRRQAGGGPCCRGGLAGADDGDLEAWWSVANRTPSRLRWRAGAGGSEWPAAGSGRRVAASGRRPAAMRRQAGGGVDAEADWRRNTAILKLGGALLAADLHDCGGGLRPARDAAASGRGR
jgi:hypothetical protein